jgi:hypothetical protein
MDSLHAVQLELVSAILDGKDVLCCTATTANWLAAVWSGYFEFQRKD